MAKANSKNSDTGINAPEYQMRSPGRPKSPDSATESQRVQAGEDTGSLRFEMRLPPKMIADLELMKQHTGNSYASYIRSAVLRALAEDKKQWGK